MARLPRWFVIEHPKRGTLSDDGSRVWFTIRLHRWHPAFWWIVFQIVVLHRDPITKR